jgi:hypothetical protein
MSRLGVTVGSLVLAGWLVGCGGSAGSTSSDGADAGSADGDAAAPSDGQSGGDAPPPADGPFACGAATCSPTQYCVNPCCGGAPLSCDAQEDGGACPPGTTYNPGACASFPGNRGPCAPPPCTPPSPYCVDSPSQASGCFGMPGGGRQLACVCA